MNDAVIIDLETDARAWVHPKTGATRYYLTDAAIDRVLGLVQGERSKSSPHLAKNCTQDGEPISNNRANQLLSAVTGAWITSNGALGGFGRYSNPSAATRARFDAIQIR